MAEKVEKKRQSRQGCFLIAALLTLVAVSIGGAAWYSQRRTAAPEEVKTEQGTQASKRFKAKAGTTREGAVALTTRNRTKTEQTPTNPGGSPESDKEKARRIRARSLSRPEEEAKLSELEKQVRSALNNLSPEKGVEQLKEVLELAVTPEEKVRVYTAMAQLYAEFEPPETVGAEKALDEAISAAPTLVDRARLVRTQAELYVQRGALDLARARIANALADTGIPGPVRMELQMTQGFIEENAGDQAKAEAAYGAVIDQAKHMGNITDPGILETVRNAGMRLNRIYRAKKQNTNADTVAAEVGKILAPPAPEPEKKAVAAPETKNKPEVKTETPEKPAAHAGKKHE